MRQRQELCDVVMTQALRASESLTSWLRVVESSAVGGLARRVYEGYWTRKDEASRAYERATTLPSIDFDEPRNARNSFVRTITWTLVFTVVALALALWFFDDLARWSADYFWDEASNRILFWSLLIVIILSLFLRALQKHFGRHLRFRRTVQLAQHHLDEAEREFTQSSMVSLRFDTMRPQLAEWTRILGHAVHRPWTVEPDWAVSGQTTIGHPLPNCIEIAEPDTADLATQRSMTAVAQRSLASVGWRTRAYQELVRRMALEEPTGDNEVDPVAAMRDLIDADSTSERNGLRSKFLHKLEEPNSSLKAAESEAAIISGAEALVSSDVMRTHTVRPVTGDLAAERKGLLDTPAGVEEQRPPWTEFLSDIADPRSSVSVETFSERTIVAHRVPGFRTVLWFPEDKGIPVARTLDPEDEYIEPPPEWLLLHSAPAPLNRGNETALRIDVAGATSPEALAVFGTEEDHKATEAGEQA